VVQTLISPAAEVEKPARDQRVGRPPRNAAVGIDALEAPYQQQAHGRAWRQAGRLRIRERDALSSTTASKPCAWRILIETTIERMSGIYG
jgi:hypothetical protein